MHGGQRVLSLRAVDDLVAGGLLRAHVGRRADRDAGLGEPLRRRWPAPVLHGVGDAEVGQHRVAGRREQDVLGLEIAVDHAERVGVGQRRRHLPRQLHRRRHAQPARARRSRSRSEPVSTYGIT